MFGERLNRRGVQAAIAIAAVLGALAAPAGAAAPASDIAPIVGTWKSGNAVIKVSGAGAYTGTIVSGSVGSSCTQVSPPGFAIWRNITGSGFGYKGTVPFVNTDDCSSVGEGPATFVLTNINSGSWSATSPTDGSTFSLSMTRVGTFPGAGGGDDKPKTNCKKKGKKVLCPAQKKFVNNLTGLAKGEKKLDKKLKQGFKELAAAKTEEAKQAASTVITDVSVKIFNLVTGRERITLPADTVPKLKQKLKQLAIKKVQDKIPEDYKNMAEFAKEADKTLKLNNQLLQKFDDLRKNDPNVATELDTRSIGICGGGYDTCTTQQKLVVASNSANFIGEEHAFHNQASNLGIAGEKLVQSSTGVKF